MDFMRNNSTSQIHRGLRLPMAMFHLHCQGLLGITLMPSLQASLNGHLVGYYVKRTLGEMGLIQQSPFLCS